MGPVRKAAIEALTILKDLGPEESDETDSQQEQKTTTQRNVRGERPWGKKKEKPVKVDQIVSDSMSANSYEEPQTEEKDQPTKKVSLATQKRREAQKQKERKEREKEKTPNKDEKKPKQSIFKRKLNPAFQNQDGGTDQEPKVEILFNDS